MDGNLHRNGKLMDQEIDGAPAEIVLATNYALSPTLGQCLFSIIQKQNPNN